MGRWSTVGIITCLTLSSVACGDDGTDEGTRDATVADSRVSFDASGTELDGSTVDDSSVEDGATDAGDFDGGTQGECDFDVKINELDGALPDGTSFVELYNAGAETIDIGGFLVTEESVGRPDLADAIEIPSALMLDPGEFLYVWTGLLKRDDIAIADGLSKVCIEKAPTPCLHAPWGVSDSGETVFLLDRDENIVCRARYPESRPIESWGRSPDGSSSFVATVPTPGASNQTKP